MAKLTLKVDDTVIERAKRYAKVRHTSVSELVEGYLDVLSKPLKPAEAPVLRSLRGSLKHADVKGYQRYLRRKYQ